MRATGSGDRFGFCAGCETAFTRIRALNLGDGINKQFYLAARGANITGVNAIDMLHTYGKAAGFFGVRDNDGNADVREVMRMSPKIAALNQAIGAIYGDEANGIDERVSTALPI